MEPIYFGDGEMLPIFFGDAATERPSGIQNKKFTFCRRGVLRDTVTKGPPVYFGDSAAEWHKESPLLEGRFSVTLVQCFLTHLGHASTERRRGARKRGSIFETSERGFAIYLSDPAAARPSSLQNAEGISCCGVLLL